MNCWQLFASHIFGGIELDLWPIPVIFLDNAGIILCYLHIKFYNKFKKHAYKHQHYNNLACEIKYGEKGRKLENRWKVGKGG